jgi:hypothetical protein
MFQLTSFVVSSEKAEPSPINVEIMRDNLWHARLIELQTSIHRAKANESLEAELKSLSRADKDAMLSLACMDGDVELVSVAIQFGADATRCQGLCAPMQLAVFHDHIGVVKLLLEIQAPINDYALLKMAFGQVEALVYLQPFQ